MRLRPPLLGPQQPSCNEPGLENMLTLGFTVECWRTSAVRRQFCNRAFFDRVGSFGKFQISHIDARAGAGGDGTRHTGSRSEVLVLSPANGNGAGRPSAWPIGIV